jgi:two-component system OmpR family sensor kinase
MFRSLRGRLVAILLLVAFAGLSVLAVVTFAAQRQYLYDRVDQQVEDSFGRVIGQLAFAQRSGTNNCSGQLPGTMDRDSTSGNGRGGNGGGATGATPGGGPGPPGLSLPPGTYGAVVDENGTVLAECVFGFQDLANYALPHFEGAQLTRHVSTIESRQSDDTTEFRAAAEQLPSGNHVVVAIPLAETDQTIRQLVIVEAIVIALVLAALGVSAWLLVGIGLRPLDRIGRTADDIAGGDLSHRVEPADQNSEIGRLGLALNRMLHRLEQAFKERKSSEQRLRQFLADASHELRTPLVSMRGYAELYRLGVARDEAEVDRSMERIEQEATRMGVLVEDMLTLARLEEMQPTEPVAVNLTELAANAVRDASAGAPEREFSLDAHEDLNVMGDPHQLQQVLANLLRNASVHTDDDVRVEVRVSRSGSDVRLDVRDHGDGLPDDVGAEIFDRFWRAEGGRERGRAGAGLGLSIVREIVVAHGGRVQAKNADGGGAIFSVWLPAATLSELPA